MPNVCPYCGCVHDVLPAERLLDMACEINRHDLVRGISGPVDLELLTARVALALEFSRRSKAFILRALVEEWDQQRIIREMY